MFAFPDAAQRGVAVGEHGLQMRAADLAMLLDGVDLGSVQRGKRQKLSDERIRRLEEIGFKWRIKM